MCLLVWVYLVDFIPHYICSFGWRLIVSFNDELHYALNYALRVLQNGTCVLLMWCPLLTNYRLYCLHVDNGVF